MDESKILHFLEVLKVRTPHAVSALHYLANLDGTFLCLDLNITRDSLETLDATVLEWFAGAGLDTVLPASPEPKWRRLAELHPWKGIVKICWKRYRLKIPSLKLVPIVYVLRDV